MGQKTVRKLEALTVTQNPLGGGGALPSALFDQIANPKSQGKNPNAWDILAPCLMSGGTVA